MAESDQQNEIQKSLQAILAQQAQLVEQQKLLVTQVNESRKASRKDLWDRLGSIAPILSGTIIAIGGTFFTLNYNQQQLKLQEAQTIERFIPHLLGDEKSKRAAILAISSLTDAKLAAKVASIFASPGTASALESLAAQNDTSSASTADRKALKTALARTLDNMAGTFVEEKRYDDAISTSKKALSLQEQSFGTNSTELVPNLNRIAELYTIHNDFMDAEATLKRSSEIQKNSYGADSMEFAAQLRRLSALYKEQGLGAKSQSIMNQAIAIEQKAPATADSAAISAAAQPPAPENSEVNSSNDQTPAQNLQSTDKPEHGGDGSTDSRGTPSTPSTDISTKSHTMPAAGADSSLIKLRSGTTLPLVSPTANEAAAKTHGMPANAPETPAKAHGVTTTTTTTTVEPANKPRSTQTPSTTDASGKAHSTAPAHTSSQDVSQRLNSEQSNNKTARYDRAIANPNRGTEASSAKSSADLTEPESSRQREAGQSSPTY